MKPRISPLAPPFSPEVQHDLEKLMPPGMPPLALFRVVAHNPRVLSRLRRGGLLDPGSISLREREIVILRTTALAGSEYEWGVHATFFGKAAGFGEEQLADTVLGERRSVWSEREQSLLALCEALHTQCEVPEPVWNALSRHYAPEQLVELVVLAGLYRMVAYVTNALRVPLEPSAARFPAASRAAAD